MGEYEEIPAYGHDVISHEAKEPACDEIGWDAYVTCLRCDYTTYAEKESLGHDEIFYDEKKPTCTEVGWNSYVTCSQCDYSTYAEEDKLGHDYMVVVIGPTCTDRGFSTYICMRCMDTYTDSFVDAKGHSFGEWTLVTAPEAGKTGLEESICSLCSEKQTRDIPALIRLPGDVDGDGVCSSSDARLALRASVGLEALNDEEKLYADADGDGIVSSADARLILRASVGLEELTIVKI